MDLLRMGWCCMKFMLTVLAVEATVTDVWLVAVLVLRFMDMTLVFRTSFALISVLNPFSFNLMLTQASCV
jgi:hypothetical protein